MTNGSMNFKSSKQPLIVAYLPGTYFMGHPAADAILYGQLVADSGGSNEEPPGFDAADAAHRVEVLHWAAVVWHHLEPTCQHRGGKS